MYSPTSGKRRSIWTGRCNYFASIGQHRRRGDTRRAEVGHAHSQHTPARVRGNADQLKQALVVLWLIMRAVYATKEVYRVSLTVEQQQAIVTVSDTGIGIAAEICRTFLSGSIVLIALSFA